jgi:rod shape determining protein RodA
MGALRVEPARVQTWATRSAGAVWGIFDVQLLLYAGILVFFGLLMAYSNSVGTGVLSSGSTFARSLLWLAIAAAVFILAAAFDYRWLRTFAWPIYFLNIGLLVLSKLVGTGVGGVARWVSIFGLQFQFSELAKILMIIVLASYLAARRDRLDTFGTFVGALVLAIPFVALVIAQPDLGTSMVFVAILVGTLFLSGGSVRWLVGAGGLTLAALPVIWTVVLRDYQKARLLSFLDPSADPLGTGYHLIQSQIAVGSGGIFGKGLANATQGQTDFLPVQTTDFVMALLAQQLGLIGVIVVLVAFGALLWRILRIGWRSDDTFGLAFAAGMASMLLFQLFVNVGMVIGIMPITGIPMPFVTYGGASLISIAVGLGILESINLRQAKPRF